MVNTNNGFGIWYGLGGVGGVRRNGREEVGEEKYRGNCGEEKLTGRSRERGGGGMTEEGSLYV